MKTDDELDQLLKTWKEDAPLPPRFKEEVWRRIGRREQGVGTATPGIRRWAEWLSVRPAWVGGYLAAVIAISVWAGLSSAESYRARLELSWRSAYVESVSPIAQAVTPHRSDVHKP